MHLPRRRDHQRPARPRLRARHRAHLPAHPAVLPTVRAREHARRHPAPGGLAARRAASRRLGEREAPGHGAAGLRRDRRAWPHEPAGNLSYGQRKLLELASLLVADPSVLLLDEPAGGVNPTLIAHLADRIIELNQAGKTFLVVEHNMEFVMGLCTASPCSPKARRSCRARPTRCARTPPCSTPTWVARTTLDPARARAGGRSHPAPRHRHACCANARRSAAPTLLTLRGIYAGYGGGDILKDVTIDVPEGGDYLRRRAQRRRQVDDAGHDQRSAAPRAGEIRFAGQIVSGLAGADPRRRHRPGPPGPQPVRRDDGARERRDGRVHGPRQAACASAWPPSRSSIRSSRERADEKAGSLSGGQQRLVEFARCLMLDPTPDHPRRALDGSGSPDPRRSCST